MIVAALRWLPFALALVAIGYTLFAARAVRRFAVAPRPAPTAPEPVSLLKPLHGAEPRLAENLASFLDQDWPAPVQMVTGANRRDDPALATARELPGDVAVRTDAAPLGANGKVANLANLLPAAAHDVLILSDSDMAVPRDYVARVAAALAQPGVGAVTSAYHGVGRVGGWSRFAAAGIGWQFLPGVVTSDALGMEEACMGSTIALRRETLARIGGFEAFADTLADDHAIGAAVRALGLRVVLAPGLTLAHGCAERRAGAVWRHELRWAATVRGVNLPGHVGSLVTHPLPLALLSLLVTPLSGLAATAVALLARVALVRSVHRWTGTAAAPLLWLPGRDVFSFGVFVASFLTRSVDWRGATLRMDTRGRITAAPEIS